MNNQVLRGLVFLALVGIAGGASAASPYDKATEAKTPWYIGVGIGYTSANIPSQTIDSISSQLAVVNGASSTIIDKDRKSTGLKFALGYDFSRYYGLEAGYAYLGETKADMDFRAGAPITTSVGTFNMKYKMSAYYLDLVGNLPLNNKWTLTGRVGAAYGKTSSDFNGQPTTITLSSNDKSEGKVREKFGAGVVYNINTSFGVKAEWEHYKLPDPLSDEKFNVDTAMISVLYHF
ncbi:MAG TPA: porin family protein [Burkholderiales bacterium]|nr:porin family protein [Burkholderiales bacterium]